MSNTVDKLKLTLAVFVIVGGLAAFYGFDFQSQLLRAGALIVSIAAAVGIALTSVPGQNAWTFAKDARAEFRKIVWPTRKETVQSTLIVIVMVILIGLFLWMLDTISFWMIYDMFLGLGG